MRLIDADALKADYGMKDDCADCEKELQGTVRSCEYDHIYSKMDFCGWIDDAPTIDAVPVIRCEDCKHYDKEDHSVIFSDRCYCTTMDAYMKLDGYCSYAERKSDE